MSLGGGDSQVVHDAVIYAKNNGCLLVAARGNGSSSAPSYPGSYPECMAVSASNSADNLAYFSSYGNDVSVAAPGDTILSTVPGNGYSSMSGTSMACPAVAGLAGLVWSLNLSMTNTQVRSMIELGSDDLGTPGFDQYFGNGRINVYKTIIRVNPIISHIPSDTENTTNPIPIKAIITSGTLITETSLYYSLDRLSFIKVNMATTGNSNEFSGSVPRQDGGTTIYYYFTAATAIGNSKKPDNAPGIMFTIKNE
jgi:subtilisin family serine protease